MPKRTQLTDAEREQRRAADRAFVQQAVDDLRSSEGWQRWLTTRRHFHSYSLRNQLLIALQKPDATRVAGFKAWLALGYCVRRGEKALRIFAPCPPSKTRLKAWRDAGADPVEKPRTFFRLTAVFDRSQVDELPPPAQPAPLDPPAAAEIDGDELAPWLEPLTALAAEIGSTVSFEPIASGADGYYRPSTKAIVVEAAHPANRQAKTLVHELSHALVRADRQEDDPLTPHTLRRTYISLMLGAGAEVPYVQAQVGHSDPSLTIEIYAVVLKRRDRQRFAEAFDALMRDAIPSMQAAKMQTVQHSNGGGPMAAPAAR